MTANEIITALRKLPRYALRSEDSAPRAFVYWEDVEEIIARAGAQGREMSPQEISEIFCQKP